MSCEKTHERYDEDEYFVRFFKVHPYLSYVKEDDELNMLKLKIQRQLIESNGSDDVVHSREKCINVYNTLIKMQNDNKKFIIDTEFEMRQMIKNIKNEMNKNMITRFQNILDKL